MGRRSRRAHRAKGDGSRNRSRHAGKAEGDGSGGMTAPAPPPVAERPRPRPAARGPRARMADAPKAPWSPFPLTELVVLLSMALIVGGVLTDGGRRGVLLGCGFALVSLAGVELALREHFAGYRSHSTLLAGASAIV